MKVSCTGSRVRLVTPGAPGELWPHDCSIRDKQEVQTCAKPQHDHAWWGQPEPARTKQSESRLKVTEVTKPGQVLTDA